MIIVVDGDDPMVSLFGAGRVAYFSFRQILAQFNGVIKNANVIVVTDVPNEKVLSDLMIFATQDEIELHIQYESNTVQKNTATWIFGMHKDKR